MVILTITCCAQRQEHENQSLKWVQWYEKGGRNADRDRGPRKGDVCRH